MSFVSDCSVNVDSLKGGFPYIFQTSLGRDLKQMIEQIANRFIKPLYPLIEMKRELSDESVIVSEIPMGMANSTSFVSSVSRDYIESDDDESPPESELPCSEESNAPAREDASEITTLATKDLTRDVGIYAFDGFAGSSLTTPRIRSLDNSAQKILRQSIDDSKIQAAQIQETQEILIPDVEVSLFGVIPDTSEPAAVTSTPPTSAQRGIEPMAQNRRAINEAQGQISPHPVRTARSPLNSRTNFIGNQEHADKILASFRKAKYH